MEQKVFPGPAVAGILTESYVEARLHTDDPPPDPQTATLQRELARSIANPIYVVVDPQTQVELGRWEGGDLTGGTLFAKFLEETLARAGQG